MITTLLATILAATTLTAADGDGPDKPKRDRRDENMCEMLECTPAQKTEVQKIHAQLRADLEAERAEMKQLRDEAKEALRAVLDAEQEEKLEKAYAHKRGKGRGHGHDKARHHGRGKDKGKGKGKGKKDHDNKPKHANRAKKAK